MDLKREGGARFSSTYTKVGTILRRLVWPLLKDDMQICEALHVFLMVSKGEAGGINWEFEIDIYTLLHIKMGLPR